MYNSHIRPLLLLFLTLTTVSLSYGQGSADGDPAVGEKLFKSNCSQCHAYDATTIVGPGLMGIEERKDYDWIKAWIHNPMAVIASGDEYAVEIYEKFNKTQMTAFPSFTDEQISGILAYVKQANEAAPVVADGGNASAAGSTEKGGGDAFNVILIALLVIMVLVLIALMAVLNVLSKITKGEAVDDSSFAEKTSKSLKEIFTHPTVRNAIIVLFILFGLKATFDGLYSIGVHQGYAPTQPIPFSHKLHAGDMEINCAYCHTGVYKGKQAGIPSPSICMNCHNSIKQGSPEIQKIYTALETDTPIEWVRVHNLPDLAYFNHSQHTNVAGLDCENCHGQIPEMEVVEQRHSLTMGWCIDCHRETDVNAKGNAYYDALLEEHNAASSETMKVADIGGTECARCHY